MRKSVWPGIGVCGGAATLALLLQGCAVGPNFVRPAPPRTTSYTPAGSAPRLTPAGSEPAQRLVVGRGVPAAWWRLFHSTDLDDVLRLALADNATLAAARATLAEAQQAVRVTRGGYYPQVDLAASAERQQGPAFALGLLPARQGLPLFNLYSVGASVGYSPDAFGLTARRVEEQQALADTRAYQLAAARLALTGNAVRAALTIAAMQTELDAVSTIVADDGKNLALVRRKFTVGRAPRRDVLSAETQLAGDRALIPALEQQRAVAEDELAVLVDRSPAAWSAPRFALSDFRLPRQLPLSLPSALVRQRPDILAAEALVHAQSAAVGVATGEMYPNIMLSGSIATAALQTGSLFDSASGVWALAAGLSAPLFHGGALRAQRREAIEGLRASLAIYRQTVLSAFGQVADTLRALGHDAALVEAERQALDAADSALHLQRLSYAAGRGSVLQLLDAERSAQQAQIAYARASAQRYLDSAQLFVALGGGWWQEREQ